MKLNNISNAFFVLILFIFVVFFVVPLIFGIYISLTDWTGVTKDYSFIGIDNYVKMMRDTRSANAVKTTAQYLALLLPTTLIVGYINATILHNLAKARNLFAFISFFPYVITPVAVSLLWNQIYYKLFVSIGKLTNIGFLKSNLLSNPNTALIAVAIVDLWMLIPFSTLLFYSSFSAISAHQVNAAKLDGARNINVFRYIKFPYLLPTIGTLISVIVSYSLTHIDTIMTLTRGGPGRTTETLYYLIYQNSMADKRYGFGAAEGIVISVVSIFIYLLLSKMTNSNNLKNISLGD